MRLVTGSLITYLEIEYLYHPSLEECRRPFCPCLLCHLQRLVVASSLSSKWRNFSDEYWSSTCLTRATLKEMHLSCAWVCICLHVCPHRLCKRNQVKLDFFAILDNCSKCACVHDIHCACGYLWTFLAFTFMFARLLCTSKITLKLTLISFEALLIRL